MPKVLNIRNLPEHKIPEGAVYCGRGNSYFNLPDSKWANHFTVEELGRDGAVSAYNKWFELSAGSSYHDVSELKGKDLVCWCAPKSCHCDILLKKANEGETNEKATLFD